MKKIILCSNCVQRQIDFGETFCFVCINIKHRQVSSDVNHNKNGIKYGLLLIAVLMILFLLDLIQKQALVN
jgi:hypothetical protein